MTTPISSPGGLPILTILIFSPLVAAAVAMLLRSERLLKAWTLAFTTGAAIFSFALYAGFDIRTAEFQFRETAAWIPALNIRYDVGIDGLSLLLVLLSTLVMPICVLVSWRAITVRVKEFMVSLLVMETAMLGIFCALDFILFFVFWEAMLIPMALLIGVWGGPRKIYAALKFFIYTMAGSVMLLVAILALYFWDPNHRTFSIPELMGRNYGVSFQCWVFLAFALSFAIKVPMVPFHTWLPAAHVEAPTAGSVLLASILLKMGAYGFLRLCLPVTPHATHVFMPWVLGFSVAAILYGGLASLAQSDMKKIVAYSSVAHMGFVTLGTFALFLWGPGSSGGFLSDAMDPRGMGLEGAILQMVNHGVTAGALFICVGFAYERLHSRELSDAAGLGKRMPIYAFFLGAFCLSSMAFPGTNNFIGEFLTLAAGFKVSTWMVLCIVPGIVIAAAYNLRMLQTVAYGGTANPAHEGIRDLSAREILSLAPLFALVVWVGLNPAPFARVLHATVAHLLEQVRAGAPFSP
ncbi:MAG: NADH-quinone oxidoreductase subunit M [Planctomycetota bacterium]